jgi:hypothetical protein
VRAEQPRPGFDECHRKVGHGSDDLMGFELSVPAVSTPVEPPPTTTIRTRLASGARIARHPLQGAQQVPAQSDSLGQRVQRPPVFVRAPDRKTESGTGERNHRLGLP